MEAKLKLKSSSASVPIVQVARNFIALFLFIHSSLPPQPYRGSSRRYWPSYPTRLKLCKIMKVMYSYLPFFYHTMPCRLFQVFRFCHSFLFDRHSDTRISISSQKTRLNKYHYLNKDYLSNGSVEERSDKKKKKRKKKAKDGRYFS